MGTAVFGLLSVSAMIAAESATRETYGETVAAVVLAIVLYWLAHSYGQLVAVRLTEGRRLTVSDLGRSMVEELPILTGASLPLLAVLIAWAAGAGLNSAIDAAVWTAIATIVLLEVMVGLRAKLSGRELLIQTVVGALLGLLVLALKLTLH